MPFEGTQLHEPGSHGGKPMANTLYERLGGLDAIKAVVEDFRDRVAGDDRINLKFARTDLARLTKMLTDQVCEATGGPCQYKGRSMKEAHAGMKVTKGEFNALVEDLVATLKQFKVASAEQDELLAILGPLKSEIVEVDSSEVGTALPDAFQETSSSTASSTWPSAVPPFPTLLSVPSTLRLHHRCRASSPSGPPMICRRPRMV